MNLMPLNFKLEQVMPSDSLFTANTASTCRLFSVIDSRTIVRLACDGCSLEILRQENTGDGKWVVKLSFSLGHKSSWVSLNSSKDMLCTISLENFVYLYKIKAIDGIDPTIVMAAGPIRLKNSEIVIDVIWHPTGPHRYLYVFKSQSVDMLTIGNEIDCRRCSIHLTSKSINKEIIAACFQPSNPFLLILLSNGTCMYLNGGDLTIVGRFRAFSNLLQKGDKLLRVVHIAGGNKIISMTESGFVVAYDLKSTQVTTIRVDRFVSKLRSLENIIDSDEATTDLGQVVSVSGIDDRTFAMSRNNSNEIVVIEIASTKDEQNKISNIKLREVECSIVLPFKGKCDCFDGFQIHSKKAIV